MLRTDEMKLDDFLMRLWMDGDDEIYLWIVKFLCMTGTMPVYGWISNLFMDGYMSVSEWTNCIINLNSTSGLWGVLVAKI